MLMGVSSDIGATDPSLLAIDEGTSPAYRNDEIDISDVDTTNFRSAMTTQTLTAQTTASPSSLDEALQVLDPEVASAIGLEWNRQQDTLEMIASENFAPVAVMQAQGSVLTNKYAEGYPGRRYYGGCEHVDVIEQLAIDRLKALFDAEYANVQPHSGAQANAAAMAALLQPGDTILGLDLA